MRVKHDVVFGPKAAFVVKSFFAIIMIKSFIIGNRHNYVGFTQSVLEENDEKIFVTLPFDSFDSLLLPV